MMSTLSILVFMLIYGRAVRDTKSSLVLFKGELRCKNSYFICMFHLYS